MSVTDTGCELTSYAQADLALLAARVFSSPQDILAGTERDRAALVELIHASGVEHPDELFSLLKSIHEHASHDTIDDWKDEHTRLFQAGVVCPINETAYIRRDKGVIMADICGFYTAFGFEPNSHSAEKADHLVCELEFAAIVLAMLGDAERRGDEDQIEIVHDALIKFLNEHLGDWIGLFHQRIYQTTAHPLFLSAAELLRHVWNVLALRLGLAAFDELNDEVWDDRFAANETPYECGMVEQPDEPPLVALTGPPGTSLPQSD